MVDFSTNTAPSIESASRVQEGVVKSAPTVSPLLDGVSKLFGEAGKILDGVNQGKQASYIGGFTQSQLAIADAYEQGSITQREATTRMRANLSKAIATVPTMQDDIFKAHSNIMNNSGAGAIVKNGTKEEQRVDALNDKLVQSGRVEANASNDEFASARTNYQLSSAAKEQFETTMETLKLENAKLDMDERKNAGYADSVKMATLNLLRGTFPHEMDQFRTSIDTAVAAGDLEAIDTILNNLISKNAPLISQVDSTTAKALQQPFEAYAEIAKKRATGEYTTAQAKAETDALLAYQTNLLTKDPQLATFAAATTLLKTLPADLHVLAGNRVSKMYEMTSKNASMDGDVANPFEDEGKSTPDYYKSLQHHITNIDKLDETQKGELKNNIVNLLSSVEDYEGLIRKNPKAGKEIAKFFGSKDFQQYVAQNPDILSSSFMEGATEVMRLHYSDEVWTTVKKEFTDRKVYVETATNETGPNEGGPRGSVKATTQLPVDMVAIPEIGPAGVRFKPLNPADKQHVKAARDLNKELSPVINNTIRSEAHLQGRTDYNKVAEERLNSLLDPNFSTDEGDDLSFEDLTERGVSTALTGILDKVEGTAGDYNTLLGHTNKKQFGDVKVSEMTIGEALEFSKPSGEYAKYSKGAVGRIATPMGRYQIVGTTLRATARELGLSMDDTFDESTQDKMFAHLVNKRLKPGMKPSAIVKALRSEWEGLKNVSAEDILEAVEELL